MEHLGIPLELFRVILKETLEIASNNQVHLLRLVRKSWNDEITNIIYEIRLPDKRGLLRDLNQAQVVEYLYRQTIFDRTSENNLQSAIHRVVDLFVEADANDSDSLRQKYIRDLCEAAVNHKGKDAIEFLVPGVGVKLSRENPPLCGMSTALNTIPAGAAYLGNTRYIEGLPTQEPLNSATNLYFGSPLQCAAIKGHFEIVRLLLERNVSPSRPMVLDYAVRGGHEDIVRLLLEPKYKLRRSGPDYESGIVAAARVGNVNLLHLLLLEYGGDSSSLRQEELRPQVLKEGAFGGHEGVVAIALESAPSLFSPVSSRPRSPAAVKDSDYGLIKAVTSCRANIVELLLRKRANPSNSDPLRGTPVEVAARRGYLKILRTLLRNSRDEDRDRQGALIAAASTGQAHIVEYLIRDRDLNGDGALVQAIEHGHESIVNMLIAAGINPDGNRDNAALNPLLAAMKAAQPAMVQLLMRAGASDNPALVGEALREAAGHGNEVVVRNLVALGADINASCAESMSTPWLEAQKYDAEEAARPSQSARNMTAILVELGAAQVDPFRSTRGPEEEEVRLVADAE